MTTALSIKNLSKTYKGGVTALKSVDLDIERGEILALLGPNGAGKTTMISIICGLVRPSTGTVPVEGNDIVSQYREARKLIGLVPHDPKLLAPRVSDVAKLIDAEVIYEGELTRRRVFKIELCARTVPNMLHTLKTGNLLVTPSDRTDIILVASMASLNGARLAGLVLTSDQTPDDRILKLCRIAWDTGSTATGICMRNGSMFSAAYTMGDAVGLVLYRANSDGSLEGLWTIADQDGVGTEVLTPR